MAVLDAGISGNRILNDGIGPSALARFDRDVLAQPSIAYLILLEGINDITGIPGYPGIVNAVDITTGLHQLIERAHEHGIRVFVGTLLPFGGSVLYTLHGERERKQVNHWIRTSGASDGVIDFGWPRSCEILAIRQGYCHSMTAVIIYIQTTMGIR
jgi:lysophospholipase L1-like esterase